MCKINCPAKLPYASLTSKEHRESQGGLNASLPEGVPPFLRSWKAHTVPQEPQNLTWKTYDMRLSRQLEEANFLIPCKQKHIFMV